MQAHVRIDHLDANPFRHIDRYPIREDKVAALIESINTTGFWDNMVGRVVNVRQGEPMTVQIAYGHHRREALRRVYPPDHMVGIVVREFDDDQMLKIMARENLEEWGSSAWVEMETVRAVVEAYGARQIELPSPDPLSRGLRYAPSFVIGAGPTSGPPRTYTGQEVAEFLGWVKAGDGRAQNKVTTALGALALIEQGHLTDAQFAGLGTSAAEALVRETNAVLLEQQRQRDAEARRRLELEAQRRATEERAARAAEERAAALARAKEAREQADRDRAEREFVEQNRRAEQAEMERLRIRAAQEAAERDRKRLDAERAQVRKAVANSMQTNLRNPRVGIDKARAEARQVRDRHAPDNSAPMDFGRFVRGLASRLARLLTQGDYADALAQIRRHRKYIPTADGDQLVAALEEMRTIIDTHLGLLGAEPNPRTSHLSQVQVMDAVDARIIDIEEGF